MQRKPSIRAEERPGGHKWHRVRAGAQWNVKLYRYRGFDISSSPAAHGWHGGGVQYLWQWGDGTGGAASTIRGVKAAIDARLDR